MKTSDDVLIMDRTGDERFYILPNLQLDMEFTNYSLTIDANQKGVKIVSYSLERIKNNRGPNDYVINVVVKWK